VIGIGGGLLVPGLTFLTVDVHQAIGASLFSFIFSGAIGALLYTRKGSIDWASAIWLCAGAAPGALAGSIISSHINGVILLVLIGATVMFAGAQALIRTTGEPSDGRRLSLPMLLAIGLVVGLASALTGTGGPVLGPASAGFFLCVTAITAPPGLCRLLNGLWFFPPKLRPRRAGSADFFAGSNSGPRGPAF
jgi:uncharacterized membrane protein YfcA